ncbi:aromatic ring-hydroxylating oxygenase subunit alpha [Paraburkholderia oxyphila]|uniref:aromatic ring-hydroxylating oxygenase subunit alpha n=1 Tax=Paraburkholderia oxyphila TaxID=614212 RepID=UPI0004848D95|nr:aromatic ring-hydroxylating dioxygenase subunit alpha [Paraburkholderia oxyphila]
MSVPKLKEAPVLSRANELDVEGEARVYRSLRHFWHVVAYSHEVTDKPVGFTLLEQDIVIVRLNGEISVFDDICPHRGTRLSLGHVRDGSRLECPYHGWQFNQEGELTLAPQRPDLAGQLRARTRKYQSVEKYGMVWVCLEDKAHFPLPEYPVWDNPDFHYVAVSPAEDWDCSAPRRVENYTDYSHFAILHDRYLGERSAPEVPPHDVFRNYNKLENVQGEGAWVGVPIDSAAWGGKDKPADPYLRMYFKWRVFMPLTCVYDILFQDGNRYHLLFHPTPMGPKKIRNFTVSHRDFGDPSNVDQELGDFVKFIYDQDRWVVESQRPEELPEDLTKEMHVKGVDKYSVEYRMWLLELAKELAKPAIHLQGESAK